VKKWRDKYQGVYKQNRLEKDQRLHSEETVARAGEKNKRKVLKRGR
jgi:hypothetical protein